MSRMRGGAGKGGAWTKRRPKERDCHRGTEDIEGERKAIEELEDAVGAAAEEFKEVQVA